MRVVLFPTLYFKCATGVTCLRRNFKLLSVYNTSGLANQTQNTNWLDFKRIQLHSTDMGQATATTTGDMQAQEAIVQPNDAAAVNLPKTEQKTAKPEVVRETTHYELHFAQPQRRELDQRRHRWEQHRREVEKLERCRPSKNQSFTMPMKTCTVKHKSMLIVEDVLQQTPEPTDLAKMVISMDRELKEQRLKTRQAIDNYDSVCEELCELRKTACTAERQPPTPKNINVVLNSFLSAARELQLTLVQNTADHFKLNMGQEGLRQALEVAIDTLVHIVQPVELEAFKAQRLDNTGKLSTSAGVKQK